MNMKRRRKSSDVRRNRRFLLRVQFLLNVTVRLGAACLLLSQVASYLHRPQEQRVTANATMNSEPLEPSPEHRFLHVSEGLPSCSVMTPEQVSYTLVTQCSEDRLWMMQHHCSRWAAENPKAALISLVVYTNRTLQEIKQRLAEKYQCPVDRGLTVQVLARSYADEDYPVNTLRNMALQAVTTTHAAYVDIDFWESTDLYSILQEPVVRTKLAQSHRHALVLPAFQLRRQCQPWTECPTRNIPLMPSTKEDMIPFLLNKTITAFDPTNFGGHGSTRYVDWVDQSADELLPIDCVRSNRYEPYLVVRVCRDLPPFQPAFTGYGKNKMTWVMQLRRRGYTFDQLGEAFVVHYPHLDSKARLVWNGGPRGAHLKKPADETVLKNYKRGQTDITFVEFRTWLQESVPDDTKVFKCEEHLDDDSRLWVAHHPQDEMEESASEDGSPSGPADAAES